jgi:hypothetical protein
MHEGEPMSETPRTSAAELDLIRNQPGLDALRVMAAFDFARTLERELAEKEREVEMAKCAFVRIRALVGKDESCGLPAEACVETEIKQLRAEVDRWKVLNQWGGTPEIVNDFIKGQQERIHATQDLERDIDRLKKEHFESLARAVGEHGLTAEKYGLLQVENARLRKELDDCGKNNKETKEQT